MPVTTLLKAIGLSNEDILKQFFQFDTFHLSGKGSELDFVPERLRARWRASTSRQRRQGRRRQGQGITARHVRELVDGHVKRIAVPNEYIVGRTLATNVIDTTTGEILAKANDELTDESLQKLLDAGVASIQTIYTNDLDQGPFISQTLRTDDTPTSTRPGRHLPDDAPRRCRRRSHAPDGDSHSALLPYRLGAACFASAAEVCASSEHHPVGRPWPRIVRGCAASAR